MEEWRIYNWDVGVSARVAHRSPRPILTAHFRSSNPGATRPSQIYVPRSPFPDLGPLLFSRTSHTSHS